MITVEIQKATTWTDISDFITDGSPVPFISRNRDYTLKIETIQLTLSTASQTLVINSNPFTPALNDGIRIKYNGTLIWAGYISKCPLNYDTFSYDLEVTNNLYYLQNFRVDYGTLHAQFATGGATQYIPSSLSSGGLTNVASGNIQISTKDNLGGGYYYLPATSFGDYGSSTLHLLWALKQMFIVAGLTLDTTAVDSLSPFNFDFSATYNGSNILPVLYSDLYLWEEMLWCINQSVVVDHLTIDYSSYSDNKISCFDYISEICSQLSFGIYQTGEMAYKLIPTIYGTLNTYNPSNDTRYSDKYDNVHQQLPMNTKSPPFISPAMDISSGGAIPQIIIGTISGQYLVGTVGFPFACYVPANIGGTIYRPEFNNWKVVVGEMGGQKVNLSLYSTPIIYFAKFDGSGNKLYAQRYNIPRGLMPFPSGDKLHDSFNNGVMLNVLANKYNASYSDYLEETLTTDIDLTPITVVQNYIDIKNQKSLIIQSPTGYTIPNPFM